MVWLKIGCINFGGPAGQIALMHRILVDEKKWIDEPRFLHALNFCMLLPGPEAQKLATYIGWLLHGVRGGLAAGILFVLPGAFVMLGLSLLYALGRGIPADRRRAVRHQGGGAGDRGRGADPHRQARAEDAPAAVAGGCRLRRHLFSGAAVPADRRRCRAGRLSCRAPGTGQLGLADKTRRRVPPPAETAGGSSPSRPIVGLIAWWAPVALAALTLGPNHVLVSIGMFFSKLAVVSFGGAYALLAYMAQQAVETHRWMTAPEMVDGLGLAETTPGPLILVTQFVGFLAAFRDAAPFSPVTAGVLGAAMTTWVTFVPSMLWIFAGAPFVEPLRANRRLSGALAAITAAVVGVILNLSVWFALHVLFGKVTELHAGPLRWYAFDPLALDLRATALAAIAAVLAFGLHRSLIEVVVAMAALGALVQTCCLEPSARDRPRSRASGAAQDAKSPTARRKSRRRRATATATQRTCAGC